MDGAEIDAVIADAITTKALSDEYQRRADWAQTCANASAFWSDCGLGHDSWRPNGMTERYCDLSCVYRKPKRGRSDDEVRRVSGVN
jgi:hypothetical protein